MTQRMTRIIVSDHAESFKCELDPAQILDARVIEEVNGEHSLSIETLQVLEKSDRLLLHDAMGHWHEYVVLGIEAEHTEGGVVAHSYYCVWSLQHDLSATFVNDLYGAGYNPGRESTPVTATRALQVALEGTSRWTIGTVSQNTSSSSSFYRRSGWEAIQTVVENWGGEIDATITVTGAGLVGRQVNLVSHIGSTSATRRFDYGHDVAGIRRTVSDDVWPCRIVPLGKSEETEAGGYTRRPSIESVNGNIPWLEDATATPLVRQPDGQGGWEYPTIIVSNDTYTEPADLKAWALEHIGEYCRPIVSYEAEVVQFEQAGMGAHGVALGDDVVVVDRTFCDGGLRIQARVVRIEQSLLDPSDIKLTIGNAKSTLADQLSGIAGEVASIAEILGNTGAYQASDTYLSNLIGQINSAANATGGYTYITEGEGIRTYDRAVSDPLVGSEATAVVEVKGGTIRIANSRTAGGDWDWRTVFVSGFISADFIHGGTLVAGGANNVNGIIQVLDANGNVISQLDGSGSTLTGDITLVKEGLQYQGARTVTDEIVTRHSIIESGTGAYSVLTGYVSSLDKNVYGLALDRLNRASSSSEYELKNRLLLVPSDQSGSSWHSTLAATDNLVLLSHYVDIIGGGTNYATGKLLLYDTVASLRYSDQGSYLNNSVSATGTYVRMSFKAATQGTPKTATISADGFETSSNTTVTFNNTTKVNGNFTVTGTKNRAVTTSDYGERLLYCYETPSPMFGDLGSGTIGGDGLCYVEVDDVFGETARTDIAYQVFLQKCGAGDLWVAEKCPTHFVVEGTPGLRFDWELKARQTGYETERLEDDGMQRHDQSEVDDAIATLEHAHEADGYVDGIESLLMQELLTVKEESNEAA